MYLATMGADSCLERLLALHELARGSSGDGEIELYHRASSAVRVAFAGEATRCTRRSGHEEGLAVRTHSSLDGRVAFAASTGADAGCVRWALARLARTSCGEPGARPWPEAASGTLLDRDGPHELPAPEEVEHWLRRATEELRKSAAFARGSFEVVNGWVEVAATVESWVADGGGAASRSRCRAWAMIQLSRERPILVAARRWPELPVGGWRERLEDRWVARPGQGRVQRDGKPIPVLFGPECSAMLVLALVRNRSGTAPEDAGPVGPAWRVLDDPIDPTGLRGGSFDDAGFLTERVVLANGTSWTGSLRGPGHYRRPAFRDRPAPLPSQLVVHTGASEPPACGALVTGLTIHALGPEEWALEVDGALLETGEPVGTLRDAFIAVSPAALVERCVAAAGPPRCSHLGVTTPALVFDDLVVK